MTEKLLCTFKIKKVENQGTIQHIWMDHGRQLTSNQTNLASASTPTKIPKEVLKHPERRRIILLIGLYLKIILNSFHNLNHHNRRNLQSRFLIMCPVLSNEQANTKI